MARPFADPAQTGNPGPAEPVRGVFEGSRVVPHSDSETGCLNHDLYVGSTVSANKNGRYAESVVRTSPQMETNQEVYRAPFGDVQVSPPTVIAGRRAERVLAANLAGFFFFD